MASCQKREPENAEVTLEKKIKVGNLKSVLSKTGRNMMKLPNTAEVAQRYNMSSRAAAGVISAWLADAGLVTENDKRLVVDRNKVLHNT